MIDFKKLKRKFEYFKKYYKFTFPEIERAKENLAYYSREQAAAHRSNDDKRVSYYQGKIDLLNEIMGTWYERRNIKN
jgi:hypothetical protein